MVTHYLNFADCSAEQYAQIIARAVQIKQEVKSGERRARLAGHTLLMLFDKPSTRTRASFIAAMTQAGGNAVELAASTLQLNRGEPIADTARALSAYGDALMIRTDAHSKIAEFAAAATCPVINGLSDLSHPCQVLADVMTYHEHRGSLKDKTVTWIGDCNNMLYSWAEAAQLFECRLHVACPPAYRQPFPGVIFFENAAAAADGADLVMTDVWASMGDADIEARQAAFANTSVNSTVMAAAAKEALFMHCLPAHRGEEVTADIIDGAQSVVWQQAENRLHAQKALLLFLLEQND